MVVIKNPCLAGANAPTKQGHDSVRAYSPYVMVYRITCLLACLLACLLMFYLT